MTEDTVSITNKNYPNIFLQADNSRFGQEVDGNNYSAGHLSSVLGPNLTTILIC